MTKTQQGKDSFTVVQMNEIKLDFDDNSSNNSSYKQKQANKREGYSSTPPVDLERKLTGEFVSPRFNEPSYD